MKKSITTRLCLTIATLALGVSALAQEAVIRKNLAQHFPELKAIDQVSKAPVNGLYEV